MMKQLVSEWQVGLYDKNANAYDDNNNDSNMYKNTIDFIYIG